MRNYYQKTSTLQPRYTLNNGRTRSMQIVRPRRCSILYPVMVT